MCPEIIVFTGDGKGKTTAALGLAVAAAAAGRTVRVAQFLKGGGYTGELFAQHFLAPYLEIRQFGHGCPLAAAIRSGDAVCSKCGECFRENRNPSRRYADAAWAYAQAAADGGCDLLVLDEISHAVRRGLLAAEKVTGLLAARPARMGVVLTGRQMPAQLLALADRITVCQAVRHPITAGIDARRGSEY